MEESGIQSRCDGENTQTASEPVVGLEDGHVLLSPYSVSSFRVQPTGVSKIPSVLEVVRSLSKCSSSVSNGPPNSMRFDTTTNPFSWDKASEISFRENRKIDVSPRSVSSLSSFIRPSLGAGVARTQSASVGEMMKKVRSSSIDSSNAPGTPKSFSVDMTHDELDSFDDPSDTFPYITRLPLIVLEFHNLTYEVNSKNTKNVKKFVSGLTSIGWNSRAVNPSQSPPRNSSTRVLDQVSGEARDGEILAVMGPSGSGKSTLIDALAQRIAPESLAGSVTLNGERVSNSLLRCISAYVMQEDLLFPLLTVAETLMFAAEVRLSSATHNTQRKRDRVDQLLKQLGLQRVANSIVGDEGRRGVSGGERRRVSIGIDIIHDPLLLFLDEPTSGLDSTSAYLLIKTLQKIAHTGSIVILSIHQPSYRILGLLDRLIILAFGHKIYGGAPSGLKTFYAAFGRPIPEHENSTEHAMDLIQELHSSATGIKPLVDFSRAWTEVNSRFSEAELGPDGGMDLRSAISASIKRGKLVTTKEYTDAQSGYDVIADLAKLESTSESSKVMKFANSIWQEVPILMWRALINISRTPELFLMRLGTVMVTGFLLATVYWGLDHTPTGVQQRLGFFTFVVSASYYTCADALPVFIQERYIFLRETSHNAYRKSSYVLANALIYIPFQAILALVFSTIIWWAVGLAGGFSGFSFLVLITWASFWTGNSFVTFISGIAPSVIMGFVAVVALLAYFQMLSGFFILKDHIPRYWIWLHYISMVKYPYEAVLTNEFDRPGICYERAANIFSGTPLEPVKDPAFVDGLLAYVRASLPNTSYASMTRDSCVLSGHDIYLSREIDLSKWANLGTTISFGIFYRILFYVILRLRGGNRRQ
ncbi:hypothetical protein R1flu_011824 [Riccia fluitans]|uniref:ABC transporter domain-containing protein n=1 Tax=Riccia fluitans TaxID=41844 RepID=A0ABD1ZD22_9MARC